MMIIVGVKKRPFSTFLRSNHDMGSARLLSVETSILRSEKLFSFVDYTGMLNMIIIYKLSHMVMDLGIFFDTHYLIYKLIKESLLI